MPSPRVQRFFVWLNADTIFFRSCIFIVGGCIFFGLVWAAHREWPIQEPWVWFFISPLGAFGSALIAVSLFASDQKFERYLEQMNDGGDIPVILFFVVVMFVAIPVTIAIRMVKNAFKQSAL